MAGALANPRAWCFYNSIRVADRNGDAHKELYVSGSFGIWRFTQPGEVMVIQ